MDDLSHLLSSSQKRLLELLKRRGELTVAGAVESLELAETTVRQHFDRLADEGLVDSESRPEGRGRPRQYFWLSERAQQLFPSSEGDMLGDLLDFLSREGYHRAIDDFFREFWERRSRRLHARLDEADPEDVHSRLEVVREFLDEEGFMPEVEIDEEGTIVIRECNCPLRESVEKTKLPCRLEAEFLQEIVGETLSRVEYIPEGHPACTYRFERSEPAEEAV